MGKPKIYLDTSVISHLKQEDVPEKMNDTLELWKQIKDDKYNVVISDVTLDEVMACSEEKRLIMIDYLNGIEYVILKEKPEVQTLANDYIDSGILRKKSIDDCMHLAFATVYECDFIASWNFKHIVNIRTMSGVNEVNRKNGYSEMQIVSPTMIIEGDD